LSSARPGDPDRLRRRPRIGRRSRSTGFRPQYRRCSWRNRTGSAAHTYLPLSFMSPVARQLHDLRDRAGPPLLSSGIPRVVSRSAKTNLPSGLNEETSCVTATDAVRPWARSVVLVHPRNWPRGLPCPFAKLLRGVFGLPNVLGVHPPSTTTVSPGLHRGVGSREQWELELLSGNGMQYEAPELATTGLPCVVDRPLPTPVEVPP